MDTVAKRMRLRALESDAELLFACVLKVRTLM